jgi:hypothetical protein
LAWVRTPTELIVEAVAVLELEGTVQGMAINA